MPNLSQSKRERMLAFLQKIKDEHRDDDDMLIALGEIESELTSKKYGLVWEQHEEALSVKLLRPLVRDIISFWRGTIFTHFICLPKRIAVKSMLYILILHTTPKIRISFMTISGLIVPTDFSIVNGFPLWQNG